MLSTIGSRNSTEMKFLVTSVLLVAAVNASPLVNSTESKTEAPAAAVDATTPTPLDVFANSKDLLQSRTSDIHYGAGNVRDI